MWFPHNDYRLGEKGKGENDAGTKGFHKEKEKKSCPNQKKGNKGLHSVGEGGLHFSSNNTRMKRNQKRKSSQTSVKSLDPQM